MFGVDKNLEHGKVVESKENKRNCCNININRRIGGLEQGEKRMINNFLPAIPVLGLRLANS